MSIPGVSAAKHSISGGEFIRWQEYFKRQYGYPSRADWYSARVAFEIALLRHSVEHLFDPKPSAFPNKVQDYILKFNDTEEPTNLPKEPTEEQVERERAEYIERSRSAWMAFVGANEDGTFKTRDL